MTTIRGHIDPPAARGNKNPELEEEMQGGTDWHHVAIEDLRVLSENVFNRIDKMQSLLDPQSTFDEEDDFREMAAYARRIDRFNREVSVMSVAPWLDVEFGDRAGEDNSLAIEAFYEKLSDRMKLTAKVSKAHRVCTYAPIVFLKTMMPNTMMAHRGFATNKIGDPQADADTPDSGAQLRLDEVPPSQVPSFDIAEVAQITPEIAESATINDMPSLTNIDAPRVEYVDPRHVITDPYVGELDEAYYLVHLITRSVEQAMAEFGLPREAFNIQRTKARTSGLTIHGVNLTSFRPMTNQDLVVLAEFYVKEDPQRPELSGLYGVMDFSSGKWVLPLSPMLVPNRWVAVRADITHPMMWWGPSYIEQAWDDAKDAAWVRREVRANVALGARDVFWIPEQVSVDPETLEELESGNFKRRIARYKGPAWKPEPPTRQTINPALLQYDQMAQQNFAKNTGATGTAQGHGQSNKVATAFNQEASFMQKREVTIRNKLYDAYTEIILIATWLIMNHGSQQFTIQKNGITFEMDRDRISGIGNYTVSAVNRSAQDPLTARLMMVQQRKELFSNPELLQHFDPKEVAKLISALNGWPSRVLAGPQKGGAAAPGGPPGGPPGGNPNGGGGLSGAQHSLGDEVDSAGATGDNTASAVAGATQRGT